MTEGRRERRSAAWSYPPPFNQSPSRHFSHVASRRSLLNRFTGENSFSLSNGRQPFRIRRRYGIGSRISRSSAVRNGSSRQALGTVLL